MQALNFLREVPVVNWLDFIVNDVSFLEHVRKPTPDPSIASLLSQFVERGKAEEKEVLSGDILPDTLSYHQNKASRLWFLAMSCCGGLNWELEKIMSFLPAHLTQELMERLVLCGTEGPTGSVRETETLQAAINSLSQLEFDSSKAFLILLYIRWVLVFCSEGDFKLKIGGTGDNKESVEKSLERNAELQENALMLLRSWLQKAEMKLPFELHRPGPECFLGGKEGEPLVPDLDKATNAVNAITLLGKIRFELLSFYFWKRNYSEARLQLISLLELVKDCENLFSVHGDQFSLSSLSAQTTSNFSETLRLSPCIRVLKLMSEYRCINEGLFWNIEADGSIDFFLTMLQNALNKMKSNSEMLSLVGYLRLFCATSSKFLSRLQKSGVSSCFGDIANLFKFIDGPLSTNVSNPSSKFHDYDMGGDDYWKLLRTFSVSEVRKLIPNLQPFQLPIRFYIPSTLEPIFSYLPSQPYLNDTLVVISSKIGQLGHIGLIDEVESMTKTTLSEMPVLNDSNLRVGVGMTSELLRIQLEKWHDMLHTAVDGNEMDNFTQSLSAQIKGFVVAFSGTQSAQQPQSICLLISTFLINNCEWKFLIGKCENFDSRFMDAAKLVAAFCTHLGYKGQSNDLRNVSTTFFDVMKRTLEDMGYQQGKRGAVGDRRPVQGMLLSRTQLSTMVSRIKEQTTLSLWLSFFGKLFNSLQGGITKIFTEHESLWPTTHAVDNINEDFLMEILGIALRNSLLTNPNNAFFLRSMAEYLLVKNQYSESLNYYMQTLLVVSQGFTMPIPENVVDDNMYKDMMKCCNKLKRHVEQGLMCQLVRSSKDSYANAVKAFEESTTFDADSGLYKFIWDTSFFEILIHSLSKQNQALKQLIAMKGIGSQELNRHNIPAVHEGVMLRRRRDFFIYLCNRTF